MFSLFFRLFFCSLLFLYIGGRWRLLHHKTQFTSHSVRLVQPCFQALRKTRPQEDMSILSELSKGPTFFPPKTSYYSHFFKNHCYNFDEGDHSSFQHLKTLNKHKPPALKVEAILWPEDAFPYGLSESSLSAPEVKEIFSFMPEKTLLFFEGPYEENHDIDSKVFNAMMVYGPQTKHSSNFLPSSFCSLEVLHRKYHLVPFGEFLPFSSLFRFLGLRTKITSGSRDYTPGYPPKVYSPQQHFPLSPLASFLPLICSEGMFPELCQEQNTQGEQSSRKAQWILNLSTDSWYFHSFGPYQHVGAHRLRAIEQGLPVVRVALNGISCVIDPLGRLLVIIPYGVMGSTDVFLPKALDKGPYAHYGQFLDLFLCFGWLLFLLLGAFLCPWILYRQWKKEQNT